jgi:hypothetical protein
MYRIVLTKPPYTCIASQPEDGLRLSRGPNWKLLKQEFDKLVEIYETDLNDDLDEIDSDRDSDSDIATDLGAGYVDVANADAKQVPLHIQAEQVSPARARLNARIVSDVIYELAERLPDEDFERVYRAMEAVHDNDDLNSLCFMKWVLMERIHSKPELFDDIATQLQLQMVKVQMQSLQSALMFVYDKEGAMDPFQQPHGTTVSDVGESATFAEVTGSGQDIDVIMESHQSGFFSQIERLRPRNRAQSHVANTSDSITTLEDGHGASSSQLISHHDFILYELKQRLRRRNQHDHARQRSTRTP